MTATPIIIDCDPGHDDAMAILLALASPELEVVGITTVSGNQTLEKTTANALRVLEFVGRTDVSVCAGADAPLVRERFVADYVHGETGMDGPDLPAPSTAPADLHAVEFMAQQIRSREGRITLVPIGPLTNVALLLALHPDLRPERVVLMGGAVGEGNRTPAAEFNIWADPEAARRVFESGIDVTMIGLDVTHQALITDAHTEELRAGGRVGRMVAELMDFYSRFHRRYYADLAGSPMHDPVAVAHVAIPDLVDIVDAFMTVDCGWDQGRGRTNVDWRGRSGNAPSGKVALRIDAGRFARTVVERITSLR